MKNLAISGKFCSGKDTLARYIMSRVYGYYQLAIADSLKGLCLARALPGPARQPLYNSFISLANEGGTRIGIVKVKSICEETFARFPDEVNAEKPRQILQVVGQRMREVDENIWINIMLARVRRSEGSAIVTDVRYKNEKRVLEDNGFVVVRLNIDPELQKDRYCQLYGELSAGKLSHPSEVDLDDEKFSIIFEAGTTPGAWAEPFSRLREAIIS